MTAARRDSAARFDAGSRRSETIAAELGYLWSNLLQRGVLETHRTIGFCAIGDGEGSNTVAANLALFLGSKGRRVALIEASLRAPAMAGIFQATSSPGLADLLAGKAVLRDVLRLQVAAGIDLVPGGVSADPYWGFTDERFGKLVKEVLKDRDLCLVDVPPLNHAPEASLVVRSLDAVVLVVEANRHREEVVRRNVAALRSLGTPVLGSIVNDLVHEIPTLVQRLI